MSQALYRQYRPQKFEDVIGQEVAVRTLRNAIEQDRVAHAYLFTGTKGTGKTTLAKLLAKAMNCDNGPTIDPCGVCETCVAIAEGRSMDVAEIDAASNTGIDSVREKIIETVAFQPSHGARRVYIIDEAHQLSKSAFNALLKTIEEPPAHVLFIFCTTETHMMMATVRDRCQRIVMKSPGPDTLVEVLDKVCAKEGITADAGALRAVSRAAQGSFRNALGTLEMLTTTFGPEFSRDDVLQHLGVVSEETLFEAADAVIGADAGAALRIVERLGQDGVDLDQFARSLSEHLRSVLLSIHGVGDAAVIGDAARLAEQAGRADERRILAAIDCLADAATRIRVGSDARISLETALVRAAQGLGLPLLALRLAALENRETGGYGLPVPALGGA
ncbi:MAG: dnaX, partial [Thermoleophilia bacterium]|nr:dnaX [Thermoleophilia bacterium]